MCSELCSAPDYSRAARPELPKQWNWMVKHHKPWETPITGPGAQGEQAMWWQGTSNEEMQIVPVFESYGFPLLSTANAFHH